jgi:anti-sigma regulatory factor (Ser/Thr protein kinase)
MEQRPEARGRTYGLPLPPHKIASRQAHRVLDWALQDWCVAGEVADNTRLVLSELVSNALAHSLEVFGLALRLDGDEILIEVRDSTDALPKVTLPDGLSVSGRGMFLVEALCKEWGVTQEGDGGKTVWARIMKGGDGN